jgi:patatin-related protein
MEQLRIGLVCYGGVSLAVYMHGITKEIQSLVQASARWGDKDAECPFPKQNPFSENRTEHHYLELLREISSEDHFGVVVDIIAGTSAGGINGIVFAKALAHDLSQDSLRDVWLEEAGISKLSRGPSWLPVKVKSPWILLTGPVDMLRGRTPSPLKGNHMLDLVYSVLSGMNDAKLDDAYSPSLPPGHTLDLYVTTTDLQGIVSRLPLHRPAHDSSKIESHDLEHACVLRFHCHADKKSESDFLNDPALSFAGRATSSFPGAFPAVRIDNLVEILKARGEKSMDRENFERHFFPRHQLSGISSASSAEFIDGGVLDNKPFKPVIDAIPRKRAGTRVHRRLLYLEPHPKEPNIVATGTRTGWAKTAWAGYRELASYESIVQDIRSLDES